MAITDKSFLGIGWSFPPAFDSETQSVKTVTGIEDISESLHILLSTSFGERVRREDFGASMRDFVFEPMNVTNLALLRDIVEKAILVYEPRIKMENILFESFETEGLVKIVIEYVVRNTNTRNNFVYPFYLKEGTNL